MSSEHHLAREARREMLKALDDWVVSLAGKTLNHHEMTLVEKYRVYRSLKKISGMYRLGKEPDK